MTQQPRTPTTEYLSGTDIEEAVAAVSPLVNPRLSEVDWVAVAAALQEQVYAIVGMTANEYDALVSEADRSARADLLAQIEKALDHEQCAGNHQIGYCTGTLVSHDRITAVLAAIRSAAPVEPT